MRTSLAALALLALPTSAAADDPPAIQLATAGEIDPGVLATSLAAELARPIAAAGDACAAPCLAVEIGEGKATVSFTSATTTRARTVALGDDRSQWPVIVTLLAGNLVRDEASDVLGLLPAKPVEVPPAGASATVEAPPEPVAPPPQLAPPPPREHDGAISLSIGLFPIASSDLGDLDSRHFLSLDVIAGVHGGIGGLALAGIADVERGKVSGAQAAGIAAVAGEINGVQVAGTAAVADRSRGAQVAGIAAYSESDAYIQAAGIASAADGSAGLQLGGIAAYAGRNAGIQIAGIAVDAGRSAGIQAAGIAVNAERDGWLQLAGIASAAERDGHIQAGGIAAYAGRDADVQVAGIAAVAERRAGAQVAGIATYAETADVQAAGLVNVASHLEGVQIAPINVADRNDGIQLGIINVGGGPDGDSFGIINIVPGGRYDVEGAVDNDRVGTLLLRHGGRHWHNVYGIGGQSVDRPAGARNDDVWMYGAGFGPTFRLAGALVDVEALAWEVNHGARHESDLSLLAQLRLTLAIPIGGIAAVAGAAINTYVSTDRASPLYVARTTGPADMSSSDVRVTLWPSAFIGARL